MTLVVHGARATVQQLRRLLELSVERLAAALADVDLAHWVLEPAHPAATLTQLLRLYADADRPVADLDRVPYCTEFLDAYTEFLFGVPSFAEYSEGFTYFFTEFLDAFTEFLFGVPSFSRYLEEFT